MKIVRFLLLVLGSVWVLSGGLGSLALVDSLVSSTPHDVLWRAPFTLALGIAALVWWRGLR